MIKTRVRIFHLSIFTSSRPIHILNIVLSFFRFLCKTEERKWLLMLFIGQFFTSLSLSSLFLIIWIWMYVPESISHALFTCISSCYTFLKETERTKAIMRIHIPFLFIWASYCHNTWCDSLSIVVFCLFCMMWCRYQSLRSNHNTVKNSSRHVRLNSFIFRLSFNIDSLSFFFPLINANQEADFEIACFFSG